MFEKILNLLKTTGKIIMLTSLAQKAKNSLTRKTKSKIEKLSWKNLNLEWTLKSGLKAKVKNQAEWVIYNDIFVDQEYDLPIEITLEKLGNNCSELRILDLGANVGFFTLRFADLAYQKFSNSEIPFQATLVEGSPIVYKELKSRLSEEPFFKEKTTVVHGLVGELKGSAQIFESDFHVMNSLFSDSKKGGIDVKYVDINSLYREDYQIDLLKCDIEGSELRLIENYKELLLRVDLAVFEFHHDKCDTNRCREILKSVGFTNNQKLRETPTFSVELFGK
ncbi:MAG TPA: FkbM family methyltransferase [Coleofasciculaceae cyanobacterium]